MSSRIRRALAGIAVAGAVGFAAACGGGDSDPLTADELRTQADAICTAVNEKTDAIAEPTSEDTALEFLKATRDVQSPAVDQLRDLTPPEEFTTQWDRVVELQETQADLLDQAIERVEGGEVASAVLRELGPTLESNSDELRDLAGDLGLQVCGSGSGDEPTGTTTSVDTTATTALPPATTAATTETTTTAGTPDTAAINQYMTDVQEAAGALVTFGTLLQSVTNLDDLRDKASDAQEALDTFDTAIAKLDGYTMDDPRLERQRSGLVAEGPGVSDVLRRFVDAAANNDQEAVQSLLPEVSAALDRFRNAATNVS